MGLEAVVNPAVIGNIGAVGSVSAIAAVFAQIEKMRVP